MELSGHEWIRDALIVAHRDFEELYEAELVMRLPGYNSGESAFNNGEPPQKRWERYFDFLAQGIYKRREIGIGKIVAEVREKAYEQGKTDAVVRGEGERFVGPKAC